MNYKKIYNQIVERGKSRILKDYTEKHHIIPKCMNGSNNKENLVELTAREHFIVHKLLTEIYPNNNGLRFATWIMVTMKDSHGRKYKIGNREYQRLKENIIVSEKTKNIKKIQNTGKNNPMFGKTHSEESIRKNRKSNIGQTRSKATRKKMKIQNTGKNNPMFGKTHSSETIKKMRESAKNRLPISEKTRKKLSISNKGRKLNKTKCSHCGFIGAGGSMKRWHFNNCKNKKQK